MKHIALLYAVGKHADLCLITCQPSQICISDWGFLVKFWTFLDKTVFFPFCAVTKITWENENGSSDESDVIWQE